MKSLSSLSPTFSRARDAFGSWRRARRPPWRRPCTCRLLRLRHVEHDGGGLLFLLHDPDHGIFAGFNRRCCCFLQRPRKGQILDSPPIPFLYNRERFLRAHTSAETGRPRSELAREIPLRCAPTGSRARRLPQPAAGLANGGSSEVLSVAPPGGSSESRWFRAAGAGSIPVRHAAVIRTRSPAHEAILLADPGLVFKPDFHRRRLGQPFEMSPQRAREVFLNVSTIRSSCAG